MICFVLRQEDFPQKLSVDEWWAKHHPVTLKRGLGHNDSEEWATCPKPESWEGKKTPPKQTCKMKDKCIERKLDRNAGMVVSSWCSECFVHLHKLCFIPYHISHDSECPYCYLKNNNDLFLLFLYMFTFCLSHACSNNSHVQFTSYHLKYQSYSQN